MEGPCYSQMTRRGIIDEFMEQSNDILSASKNRFTANQLHLNKDKNEDIPCTLKEDISEDHN